jgi:Family of unknown function (DUF6163)
MIPGTGFSIPFLRIVSLVLVLFALQYWMRLTGIFSGSEYRFDTMTEHWRIAALAMAIGLPVTALGLWSGASWGIVLWIPVAAIELVMYLWFDELYGTAPFKVGFHIVTIVVFVGYSLLDRFLTNKTLTH